MNELQRIEPKPLELIPQKPIEPERVQSIIVVNKNVTAIDDNVSIWRILYEWFRQNLINDILQIMEGKKMNNDLKTTVTGIVTGIASLVALFGFQVPASVVTVIVALGVMVLGYFTNKKDA